MSLPPERISVKRRRQEEPVDTLVLEHGSAHDKKRRFTDFFFQRLHNDKSQTASIETHGASTPLTPPTATRGPNSRDYGALGIPLVKSSKPSSQVAPSPKLQDAQNGRSGESSGSNVIIEKPSSSISPQTHTGTTHSQGRRHFHLARDISSLFKPNPTGGIRRPRPSLRPPLATFVERHSSRHPHDSKIIYQNSPVDRLVDIKDITVAKNGDGPLPETSIVARTPTSTFLKSPSTRVRHGSSISDDPTTWDQDSDQLANELAALAFDIDPGDATEPPQFVAAPPLNKIVPETDAMAVDRDDEFVFETYVRVKHDPGVDFSSAFPDTEIGVLVIDDENEDLWEKYIQSDDEDDEWDDEDEDSNAEDNPRNEYPDDEVSTDDEFGRNAYRYRRNASDDEEFDEDHDEW